MSEERAEYKAGGYDDSELKPCPFCGKDACYVDKDGIGTGEPTPRCSCQDTQCMPIDATLSIEDWNTRPIEDALQARIADLARENAALKEAQLKDPLKMTEDELREFLSANGYDYDDLRHRGSLFIANLKNKLFQPPEAE